MIRLDLRVQEYGLALGWFLTLTWSIWRAPSKMEQAASLVAVAVLAYLQGEVRDLQPGATSDEAMDGYVRKSIARLVVIHSARVNAAIFIALGGCLGIVSGEYLTSFGFAGIVSALIFLQDWRRVRRYLSGTSGLWANASRGRDA